jgi:hypothetical protein
VQRSSTHFKAWPLDTVITQGRPYRHVLGYESGERRRAERDVRYKTALRTGEYPLITWGWDHTRVQQFLRDTLGVGVGPQRLYLLSYAESDLARLPVHDHSALGALSLGRPAS